MPFFGAFSQSIEVLLPGNYCQFGSNKLIKILTVLDVSFIDTFINPNFIYFHFYFYPHPRTFFFIAFRERETLISCLLIWALTRDKTCNLGICPDWELNP